MDKYIGKVLDDRYEILEVIGVGGMAVVYKAMDHRLNRFVAVKILKDDFSTDADFRRRFHGESQAVAMMSHPNIVSVYDVSKSSDLDYIVMELIDGITLKQYMEQKGPLSWRETLHFSMQIAKALEHAHSRNIIHRDIKPHNVMILKDGSVKVADFGIARIASATSTLTKEALGSVHYISPEQAKGARVDARTDIYSLGVVMYEMLTGRPPYDGETPVSVAIQHINGTPLAPSLLNSEIPTGLEQITMHAMCSDLNIRYASISDMLQDMEEFRKNPTIRFTFLPARAAAPAVGVRPQAPVRPQTLPARPDPREVEYVTSPEEKRRKILLAVGAGLGVVALIIIALLLIKALSKGGSSQSSENQVVSSTLPDKVEVPPLVGSIYSDIPKDEPPYSYFQFIVNGDSYQYNDEYPDGVIFEQSIPGGAEVAPGTEIFLYISMGERTDTMPNLSEYVYENAVFMLEAMELDLHPLQEQEFSDEIAKGRVIRTVPEAGSTLVKGQVVTVYVSKGRESVELPNFTNMPLASALQKLKDLDLKAAPKEDFSDTIAVGSVISQSPAPNTEVEPGTTVTLVVSKGKATKQMVSVIGADSIYAKPLLEGLGLHVTIVEESSSTVPKGQVISQSINPGTEVSYGMPVTLVVSTGPAPEPVTEPDTTEPGGQDPVEPSPEPTPPETQDSATP